MSLFIRRRIAHLLKLVAVVSALAVAASAPARPVPSATAAPAHSGPRAEPPRQGLVCAFVFDDGNGNGNFDKGDVPLPGQIIQIATAKGAPLARGATAKDGRYCTPKPLPDGEYQASQFAIDLSVKARPGLKPGKSVRVSIVAGKTATAQFASRSMLAEPKSPPKVLRRAGSRAQGTGNICIEKYNDLNNNGVRDAGEPPLAGWQFILWHYTVGNIVSGSTGADGLWCPLEAFADATYLAKEVSQANWTNTDPVGPASKWVPVWADQTTTVQFGNRYVPPPPPPTPPPPIQFCIEKFNDLNGDGVRQANEPGLSDWNFTISLPGITMSGFGFGFGGYAISPPLTTVDGKTCATVSRTPSNFPTAGLTTISEWPQAGWTTTTPQAGYHLVQARFGDSFSLQFGNKQTTPEFGQLCVSKYEDLDGDGQADPNEPPLAGWTFTVSSGASGATGASGRICMKLPIGGHTVTETMQPGWVSTDPGGGAPSKPVYIAAGQTVALQFGNRRLPPPKLGKVCARKYEDVNGDGNWQAGEPFTPGVPFTVTNSSGTVVASGVTAMLGIYCTQDNLPAGNYTITETVPSGWTNTQPSGAPSVSVTVTLPQGVPPQPRFGNRKLPPPALPGELCVEKFNDLNGNGARDGGEPPLSGWSFTRSGGGLANQSGTTGANGRWCPPTMLPPGAYTVTETMTPGWISTNPGGATPTKTAVVGSNQTVTLQFGNRIATSGQPALTMKKTKFTPGNCHGSQPGANDCVFRFTVTNTGGAAYTGPLTITDTVTLGTSPLPVSVVSPPPGWSCSSGTATPIVCSTPTATIAANTTLTYDLTLNLNAPMPVTRNCAVLAWGNQQTMPSCAQIFP